MTSRKSSKASARQVSTLLALFALAHPAKANVDFSIAVAAPSDFAELQAPRDVIVDVYLNGRPLGEARATIRTGFVRFRDPAAVAALLAKYGDAGQIELALQVELASNARLACSDMNNFDCGHLLPETVGVIFDEDRFRVDIFLSSSLATAPTANRDFLEPSSRDISVVNSFGAALSGTSRTSPLFNFQSRTLISLGDARLKSNISYSSDLGAIADDLVVEIDKPNWRYSAGLFWTPGSSLVGRRRILGIGAGTQFDTRMDREALEGTPVPLFLQQRSLVDVLIDGRLAASQTMEAGNQLLDTTNLPEGSYPIVLRIRESGRGTRDERRFFIKDTRLAPEGRVRIHAFVGLLSPTRDGDLINPTKTAYYQIGAAKRLTPAFGIDATLLGTQDKAIGEGGMLYLNKHARIRVGGLISTSGEYGGLLQIASSGHGPAQFSFDLRRIWAKNGDGLIPGSYDGVGFDAGAGNGVARQRGDYVQMNAAFGYRWGSATFRIFASYYDPDGSKSDFNVGPSADWLFMQRRRFQVRLEADAQKTRQSSSAYLGVRFHFASGGLALTGSAGPRFQHHEGNGGRTQMVGTMGAEWSGKTTNLGRYSIGAGIDRAIDSTTARANGSLYSRHGIVRADLLQDFGGATQYALAFQTGAILGSTDIAVGGQNIDESALLVEVNGDSLAGKFEVLVNDAPLDTVAAGQRTTLFMQPYRSYEVRVRPLSGAPVHYDTNARQVTLFPGNVVRLAWDAVPTFTVFGQVVGTDGKALGNSLLQGAYGTGQSNGDGFFQIDVAKDDRIILSTSSGPQCQLRFDAARPIDGYFAAGKVVCQ